MLDDDSQSEILTANEAPGLDVAKWGGVGIVGEVASELDGKQLERCQTGRSSLRLLEDGHRRTCHGIAGCLGQSELRRVRKRYRIQDNRLARVELGEDFCHTSKLCRIDRLEDDAVQVGSYVMPEESTQ